MGLIYIPDDENLRRKFGKTIAFVWKPVKLTHNELEPLFQKLGIPKLTEETEITLNNVGDCKEVDQPECFTNYTKQLLLYMIYNESRERFDTAYDQGVVEDIAKIKEVLVDSLIIDYKLKQNRFNRVEVSENTYLDSNSRLLYFKKGIENEDIMDDFSEVMARKLWGNRYRTHVDEIRVLLGVKSQDRFKKLRDRKGWNIPPELNEQICSWIGEPDELTNGSQEAENNGEPESEEVNRATVNSGLTTSHSKAESKKFVPGVPEHGNDIDRHSRNGNRYRGARSRSKGIASSINQARRNQMRSYVVSELSKRSMNDNEQTKKAQETRRELGEQAELEVLEDLRSKGFSAERMPLNNPGFDIEATNPQTKEKFLIEVKGDSFSWSEKGVGITSRQYEEATLKRGSYFLAVVENIQSSPRTIHYIRDPIGYITEYRFDVGWRDLATNLKTIELVTEGEEPHIQLMSLTENQICRQIIEFCHAHAFPLPEIGLEIVNDDGKVIFENVELAWELERIAVLLDESQKTDFIELTRTWRCFTATDVEGVYEALNEVFGAISGN